MFDKLVIQLEVSFILNRHIGLFILIGCLTEHDTDFYITIADKAEKGTDHGAVFVQVRFSNLCPLYFSVKIQLFLFSIQSVFNGVYFSGFYDAAAKEI